jgi:hypothetical protein
MPPQTQSDPWVEAAKSFNASGEGGTAPAQTGNDDWKVWQQGNSPQPDSNPGMLDTIKGAFDNASQTEPFTGPGSRSGIGGFVHTFADNLGAGATRLFSPIVHPMDTIRSTGKMINAYSDPSGLVGLATDTGDQMLKNPAGEALAALPSAALGASSLMRPEFDMIPESEVNAEGVAKAALPSTGITPNLLKSIRSEAPAVREYAARTGNPLRSIPQGIKAASGVADEGLQHYRQNFLEPNAETRVMLENGVSPDLGHSATLAQIEKRISAINDLTRPAAATAKSGGAEMTAQERLGLENEGKTLRAKLYDSLSQQTGVSPDEIRDMREGYGGQYTLKNALESGHMARLERTGRVAQGENSTPLSKTGIVDRTMTALRGGESRIADRQFRSSIAKFDPQSPFRPVPKPPSAPQFQDAPVSPEMASRIGAVGTDSGVQPRATITPRPLNGPLQSINDVPALREASDASNQFRAEQAATTTAERNALTSRERELLTPARDIQERAKTLRKIKE